MKKYPRRILILTFIGVCLIGIGVIRLFYINDDVESIKIEKYGIRTEPEKLIVERHLKETDLASYTGYTNIQNLDLSIHTFDVYSVNNPIFVDSKVRVKDPNKIAQIGFLLVTKNVDILHMNNTENMFFMISNQQNIIGYKKSSIDPAIYEITNADATFFAPTDNITYVLFIEGSVHLTVDDSSC